VARGWEWWEGEQGKGRPRLKLIPGGPTTIDRGLTMAPVKDADVANGSIFVGADHGGQPCFKDSKGKVSALTLGKDKD
jgi:hypothetical protein